MATLNSLPTPFLSIGKNKNSQNRIWSLKKQIFFVVSSNQNKNAQKKIEKLYSSSATLYKSCERLLTYANIRFGERAAAEHLF